MADGSELLSPSYVIMTLTQFSSIESMENTFFTHQYFQILNVSATNG